MRRTFVLVLGTVLALSTQPATATVTIGEDESQYVEVPEESVAPVESESEIESDVEESSVELSPSASPDSSVGVSESLDREDPSESVLEMPKSNSQELEATALSGFFVGASVALARRAGYTVPGVGELLMIRDLGNVLQFSPSEIARIQAQGAYLDGYASAAWDALKNGTSFNSSQALMNGAQTAAGSSDPGALKEYVEGLTPSQLGELRDALGAGPPANDPKGERIYDEVSKEHGRRIRGL